MKQQSEFNYKRYLASREWALLKVRVAERSGGTCERCKQRPHEETHHLTYERIGNELLEDLQGLCRPCHEFLSAKSDRDPCQEQPVRLPPQIDFPRLFGIDGVLQNPNNELVGQIQKCGNDLPLDPEAFDLFNKCIQRAIELATGGLALELAQIKLHVNRRLYFAMKEQ